MNRDIALSLIKVIGLIIGFANQLIFTKVIGVKAYGVYTIFSTWTSILSLVLVLGYDKIIIKELSFFYLNKLKGKFKYTLDKLIKLIVINSSVFLFISFLIPHDILRKTFFSQDILRSTWLLIAVGTVVITVFLVLGKLLSATQRVELTYIRSEVIHKIIIFLSVIFLYFFCSHLVGINIIVVGTLVGYILTTLIFFLIVDRKKISQYFKIKKEVVDISNENYIFFFTTFNYFIISRIGIIVLGRFESLETVGVYGLVITLLDVATFSTIVYQRFLPKISYYIFSNNMLGLVEGFKNVVRNALLISLPFLAFVIVFAEDILLFFGENYVSGVTILRVLLIGRLMSYFTGPNGSLLINGNHSRIDLYNSIAVLIISCASTFLGYKYYGVLGIAVATSFCIALINILKVIEVKFFYSILPYDLKNILLSAFVVFVFGLVKLINFDISSNIYYLAINFSLGTILVIISLAMYYLFTGRKQNIIHWLYLMKRAMINKGK